MIQSKLAPGKPLEVLVFTSVKKDAEITANVLNNAGVKARAVGTLSALYEELLSAGAVILSEESLSLTMLNDLKGRLDAQPQWSDLPIITVTSGGSTSTASSDRLEWMATHLQNVTLLERPIRLATLITIVRTALSSRRKQFELKAILEDLKSAKVAAEEANHAKSMFLANMSHEIRTPLAAIVGFAGLMRDEKTLDEERLQFADVIARNGDQLASLINDILDLSKVEAGKLEIEKITLSFGTFVSELTSWLQPMAEAKGLNFVVELGARLPDVVEADSTRIRQVLLNLVSNAVKFTQAGSIKLTITSVPSGKNSANVSFEVSDTGIGMSAADQQRIFKPFSQADSSMTRRFGGTGLGLVLSKAIANAMGGDLLLLSSEKNTGSVFKFELPLKLVHVEKQRDVKPVEDLKILQGARILLVEDSPDNQYLMSRFLIAAGSIVETAENGRIAVDRALATPFDVILMDIQMPVLDGLSATKELRQKNYSKPIIALTAHALREEKERSLNAGCNDHLTKPIDRAALIATVSSYVGHLAASNE